MRTLGILAMTAMIAGFFSPVSTAFAQVGKPTVAPQVKLDPVYRRVQRIDMTGSTITGTKDMPLLSDIVGDKLPKQTSLIQLRKNWKSKIDRSVSQL